MRVQRSRSQILFGFLPEQTVDLEGRTWKVREWLYCRNADLDLSGLRNELIRQASAWRDRDHGFTEMLMQGRSIQLQVLESNTQVLVEPYPNLWMCRSCNRIKENPERRCTCGANKWGQLPYVGVHECGAIATPYIPSCPVHRERRVTLPGTASALELIFDCPICRRHLQNGLGFMRCGCGNGLMSFNVHRASQVFTPRSIVLINPPSREQVIRLEEAGGKNRALAWVLKGMQEESPFESGLTRESFLEDLARSGIDRRVAEQLADAAEAAGQFDGSAVEIPVMMQESKADAEQSAVTLAIALTESRIRISDMAKSTESFSQRGELYRTTYPKSLERAKFEAVELIDQLPVLTGVFGYTRGKTAAGESDLNFYRDRDRGRPRVFADLSETEGLLFRLSPRAVGRWLEARGHSLAPFIDDNAARAAILQACAMPAPGEDLGHLTAGADLLTLVHSCSHRVMRRAASFAGIDRSGLGELLIPQHLSFITFASARGDFVLGGLQAVFESELHNLIDDVVLGEHRCVLDPGCINSGGACMACLHVGEPSCRWFNQYLDRRVLTGRGGYWTAT